MQTLELLDASEDVRAYLQSVGVSAGKQSRTTEVIYIACQCFDPIKPKMAILAPLKLGKCVNLCYR